MPAIWSAALKPPADRRVRRKAAFLLPDMKGGGAERVALRLMEAFLAEGHAVDLLLMAAEGELMGLLPEEVRIVDLRAPRIRGALGPIRRYLREARPDSLQVSMWPLTAVAIAAHRLARSKTRLVVSDHTILSRQYESFGPGAMAALRLTARLLYPLADARVGVSAAVAEDLARLSGLPVDRMDVIYNPLPAPLPASPQALAAAEAAWLGAERRLLSVGSIKAEKNYPLLIRAFARMVREGPARLVILGDGPMKAELEALIAAEGLAPYVHLAGFVVDPAAWYETADLFVLSSDFEGFGNVLVEAMRAGLPVVSTDCGGPREILDGGAFGRLVPVGNEAALAEAMRSGLDAPSDEAALRARAEALSGAGSVDRYLALMLGAGARSSPAGGAAC